MAKLPYLEKEDVAEKDRDLLSGNINLMKLLAHSPEGARSFGRLGIWIRHQSHLDPRLRELAILQVGYLTRTEYEYAHHLKVGRDFGLTDEDIRAVAIDTQGGNTHLDEVARLTLRAAREMTSDLEMREETFQALLPHLGNEGMVDLTVVIAFYNAVVRILRTLAVDVEASYLPYLEEFPLPSD